LCKIGNTKLSGTVIRWKSDCEIFTETTRYDFDVLQNRFREIVNMNSGIQITLRDEREHPPKEIVLKG
ncbi:MAG: DNA topoisomerase IV subunit B, partial [Treponema sp.]|nr:DNA topoisomerase IV subunit B [Treponema sp.]